MLGNRHPAFVLKGLSMATAQQLADLRLLVSEPDETTYTEQTLSDRIDAAVGDLDVVAAQVWEEKAARYARLVDVSEGGSSRKMGDLQDNALLMVKHFNAKIGNRPTGINAGAVRISRLRRA